MGHFGSILALQRHNFRELKENITKN